ncbi:hypothetical protein [Micromonospora musae]|uniref:hypothetical protein n=1 Tax=Micromonospora musae TaxID=1894970 RepID=UPI0011C38C0B|nr:hypothetical protein [Micromonospora musae]
MSDNVTHPARRCASILAAATLLLASCAPEEPAPSRRLGGTDAAHIVDVAWNNGNRLFALYTRGSDDDPSLAEFTSDGELRPFELVPAEFCANSHFFDLSTLPDGTLAAVVTCGETDERFAAKIDGQKLIGIASLGAPNRLVKWNPDMRTGWLELVTGQCRGMGLFQNGKATPFPSYQTTDDLDLDLRAGFLNDGSCATPGRAGFADVGTDGKLYFLASVNAVGSFEDPDVPWQPLVFDPRSGQLRKFGPEFRTPYELAVVPNSDSVVVTGVKDGRRGAWLVSAGSRDVELLASGPFYAVGAALDGRRIAIVHSNGNKDEVLEVEVK